MKTSHRVLQTVCILAFLTLWVPKAHTQAQLTWVTNNGTITITGGCPSSLGAVVIPQTINGLPVTGIERATFAGCTNVTSVTIPSSVTSIGEEAFARCSSLSALRLNEGLQFIGVRAFAYCENLGSVIIPDSVTRLEARSVNPGTYYTPFEGCSRLGTLVIGSGLTNINSGMFNRLISLTNVFIPDSVISIGNSAFESCTSLISVMIPNSVTSIGGYAFSDCTSLTSVMIPNSVTIIGGGAFRRCTSLTSVTIPNSVTSIRESAFESCTSLSDVKLSESLTAIHSGTFANCSSLTTVTLPAKFKVIFGPLSYNPSSSGAFYGCPLTTLWFEGDAPFVIGVNIFTSTNITLHYLPGKSVWGKTFKVPNSTFSYPTALWVLPEPVILKSPPGPSLQTNGFGFCISWATNSPVVVEATTSLSAPDWSPVSTNILVDGWVDFRDPSWADNGKRFYRVRGP